MKQYQAVKGMQDIFPDEVREFVALEATARVMGNRYGYREIRTPLVETTNLFVRSIGEDTDIVEKEMFSFSGPGDKSLSLRPEGTAGVVRAYIEHSVFSQQPLTRYLYLGPMFRRERPQAGRRRQFHQFGIEALGSGRPAIDVEIIELLVCYLEAVGLDGWELGINSVGCPRCRPAYRTELSGYLKERTDEICENCRRRLTANPLRVLDCKNPGCRSVLESAPKSAEHLCDRCEVHDREVRSLLSALEIPFTDKPFLVRGLDYYTSTVYEVYGPSLGAQDAVAGGGRYDTLIEELGGPSLGASGFSVGLERLLLSLAGREIPAFRSPCGSLYLASVSPEAFRPNFILLSRLRRQGFNAVMDYLDRSLKAQMREANKLGVDCVLIRGEEEMEKGGVKIKKMKTGQESFVQEEEVLSFLRKKKDNG